MLLLQAEHAPYGIPLPYLLPALRRLPVAVTSRQTQPVQCFFQSPLLIRIRFCRFLPSIVLIAPQYVFPINIYSEKRLVPFLLWAFLTRLEKPFLPRLLPHLMKQMRTWALLIILLHSAEI